MVQEAKLVEVHVLEKSLASVDLGLVVLSIHEDLQEALGGFEREHL